MIYLDNNATTPVDPRVLEEMLPFLREHFGNPSSTSHASGIKAAEAVDKARSQVAGLLNASPDEIVFTSGATESDNLAIIGAAEAPAHRGKHIVTSVVEHPAVRDSCRWVEQKGRRVSWLPVDRDCLIDPAELQSAITRDTALVSIMAANNETGVIQPISALAAIAHSAGALFHTDAAQAVGKIPIDVDADGVDLLSLTGHKLYAPKGVGALYVRKGVDIQIQMHGGGHESGRRSGTLNVPGIVALGAACEIAQWEMAAEGRRLRDLRDDLWRGLSEGLPRIWRNGHAASRVPGCLNVGIFGVSAASLLADLPDLAVSSAAACHTGSTAPSYVLTAMGLSRSDANSSIRFGIGRFNTREEIDAAIAMVIRAVQRLREISPLWDAAAERGTANSAFVPGSPVGQGLLDG